MADLNVLSVRPAVWVCVRRSRLRLSDRALVPRVDCIIGEQLSGVQLILIWGFWGAAEGNFFFLEGGQSTAL